MEIREPIREKDVIDLDFMFNGGQKLTVTLDEAAGDTFQETSDSFIIHTTAKPSLADPEEFTDPEHIRVFKNQLAVIARCERKQQLPSEEDLFNMRQTLHELAKGVQ